MSQKLPHLNFPIVEGPKSSYMFGLTDTGTGLNLGSIYCNQSVAEHHPNLELKISYLKDLDSVDPFNISDFMEGVKGTGKRRDRRYCSSYLQNSICGKFTTGDSIPCSRIRVGMQHHLYIDVPAKNKASMNA